MSELRDIDYFDLYFGFPAPEPGVRPEPAAVPAWLLTPKARTFLRLARRFPLQALATTGRLAGAFPTDVPAMDTVLERPATGAGGLVDTFHQVTLDPRAVAVGCFYALRVLSLILCGAGRDGAGNSTLAAVDPMTLAIFRAAGGAHGRPYGARVREGELLFALGQFRAFAPAPGFPRCAEAVSASLAAIPSGDLLRQGPPSAESLSPSAATLADLTLPTVDTDSDDSMGPLSPDGGSLGLVGPRGTAALLAGSPDPRESMQLVYIIDQLGSHRVNLQKLVRRALGIPYTVVVGSVGELCDELLDERGHLVRAALRGTGGRGGWRRRPSDAALLRTDCVVIHFVPEAHAATDSPSDQLGECQSAEEAWEFLAKRLVRYWSRVYLPDALLASGPAAPRH
ncbi:hypothetical protein H696_05554 [Fonticula alba]|uniref:Uncharacterized protein n=1 Tax=Fonticula alba TaxID=691883 RepID=A0A058Z2R9_FONAL|nr:hypothetical protein H696_05554 [Fonticula alba]KCV67822.1 hypothetical protein H696_05554 [Fonticula alba]|eukprot:XP_009497642.1 hypothetical protein H696_05554 [Fonticula alba]